MFWWLWNYLNGYVIIKVSGFSAERFINLAVINGVNIWDIKSVGNERIMKAGVKNFKNVDMCAQRCGCRVERVKNCGLPFILKRLWKRKIFSVGIGVFACMIFILSQFIWVVETEGNEKVSTEEILDFCAQNSVAPGKLKRGADLKELGRKLILNFDDIGWAAVNIKGTRIVVSVAENIEKPQIYAQSEYCSDIAALKDGVVESIIVESGTALVQAGDVVEKGDILIKGEIILKDGEVESGRKYADASGRIEAKTVYSFSTEALKSLIEKEYTGEKKKYLRITADGREMIFLRPEGENFDSHVEFSKEIGIGDFKLPLKIETLEAEFFEEKTVPLTEEEAEKALRSKIEEKKEELLKADAYIIDEKTVISSGKDRLKAETELLVIEDIGTKVKTNNIQGEFVSDGTKGNSDNS